MSKKLAYFFISISIFCWSFSAYPEVIDKIVVIVNDEIITQGELDRILRPIYQQYKMHYTDEELALRLDEARKNVLQKLIEDKLLLSEARRKNIEVDDKEIKERMNEVTSRFSSEEEFKRALAEENLQINELKKRFRERIMIEKLIDMEIKRTVSISPTEALNYYEAHKDMFKEPNKIRVRSILIRINEKHTLEDALKLANELLTRLQEGGDFGLLAKEYSEGPYADSGGDMGWVREGELMDRINDFVFGLNENEISGILKTKLGFHIFKVEEKMPSKIKEFNKVKDEIERMLYSAKVEERLKEWLAGLKRDAYIAFR